MGLAIQQSKNGRTFSDDSSRCNKSNVIQVRKTEKLSLITTMANYRLERIARMRDCKMSAAKQNETLARIGIVDDQWMFINKKNGSNFAGIKLE